MKHRRPRPVGTVLAAAMAPLLLALIYLLLQWHPYTAPAPPPVARGAQLHPYQRQAHAEPPSHRAWVQLQKGNGKTTGQETGPPWSTPVVRRLAPGWPVAPGNPPTSGREQGQERAGEPTAADRSVAAVLSPADPSGLVAAVVDSVIPSVTGTPKPSPIIHPFTRQPFATPTTQPSASLPTPTVGPSPAPEPSPTRCPVVPPRTPGWPPGPPTTYPPAHPLHPTRTC